MTVAVLVTEGVVGSGVGVVLAAWYPIEMIQDRKLADLADL